MRVTSMPSLSAAQLEADSRAARCALHAGMASECFPGYGSYLWAALHVVIAVTGLGLTIVIAVQS
jgi:hypothetical protein